MGGREKIISDEIKRLKQAWRNAQDRYAYCESRSTERTMHKYETIWTALEDILAIYEERNNKNE